jgi:hypothetical protein
MNNHRRLFEIYESLPLHDRVQLYVSARLRLWPFRNRRRLRCHYIGDRRRFSPGSYAVVATVLSGFIFPVLIALR